MDEVHAAVTYSLCIIAAGAVFVLGTLWAAGRNTRRAQTTSDRPPAPLCLCGHMMSMHSGTGCYANGFDNGVAICPCVGFIPEGGDA